MIKLKLFNLNDRVYASRLLLLLAAISAGFSSQLILSVLLLSVVLFFERMASILGFINLNRNQMTLIIFPDGRVRLKSGHTDTIEGYLGANQWCTRHFAVLRIVTGGQESSLAVLSLQQQESGDFRRLNMWLRQNIYHDTRDERVSGI